MDVGILKETYAGETRVALTPFAAGELVRQGNRVVIETEAGAGSGFLDQAYRDAGVTVVYSADEAVGRSRLVLKVVPPSPEECRRLDEGQILFSFLQLSNAPKGLVTLLLDRRITAIGFEAIEELRGRAVAGVVFEVERDEPRLVREVFGAIDLVEEGVTWFSRAGARVLKIPFDVR